MFFFYFYAILLHMETAPKTKKIMLTGGGTLGPVTPLIAIANAWSKKSPDDVLVWVGTKNGPERDLIMNLGIKYLELTTVKLPRYFSLDILFIPFRLIIGFYQAYKLLKMEKPYLVLSAGGFTSVPIVIVARFIGIISWVHQQDVRPGLANKIMAHFANHISVSIPELVSKFPRNKTKCIGNPVRESVLKPTGFGFDLNSSKFTLLVTGGGSGALWLNSRMKEIAGKLSEYVNVIHITGKGKNVFNENELPKDYHVFELLTDRIADAYASADLVVSRAGMGTIAELCALAKPAILIPIPSSHQEDNAKWILEKDAASVLLQKETNSESLFDEIIYLFNDRMRSEELSSNISTLFLSTDPNVFVSEIMKAIS
ncbi:MAG: Undecaprenyldiphospho-muramoylpentapeptide beta-N-acetylglucosaminyltransferase [uncultured bacterium]|nr:MAG: Undecaprenyldiphospho-muramoylpentapeptide beta-N-acetylglucosaminyltransferase [uncultured bacterium]HBD05016.1 hypothetical protein [Candidatus Uhrbacteria bacterium]